MTSQASAGYEIDVQDVEYLRHGDRPLLARLYSPRGDGPFPMIVDLHGAKRLNDIDHIEATLRRCVEAARATLLHIHLHHFQPSGVSGVAVLAESHISIHTWPEAGYAALDIFMCGSAEPDNCIPVLREAFEAKRVDVNEILRGQEASQEA